MLPSRLTKALAVAGLTFGLVMLAASHDLIAGPNPKDVEKYTNDLKSSKDVKVRVTALAELGKAGQIQRSLVLPAESLIYQALDDKEPPIRIAAARCLGMIDPDPAKAVPALLKLLNDEKEEPVKIAAIQGLGYIGTGAKDAVKDLKGVIKMADKKSKISAEAKRALTTITPPKKKD